MIIIHQDNTGIMHASLLDQPFPGISAAALCARPGHWGMKGILFLIAHIRPRFRSLYKDADGTMRCFVWHKDQKAVCHCLAAILNLADDTNQDASSYYRLAEWTIEILSLSW